MLLPHHQRGPPRQLGEACGEVTPFFFLRISDITSKWFLVIHVFFLWMGMRGDVQFNLSPTFSVVVQKRCLSSDRFNRKQDSGTIPLSMFISKLNNLYVHMLWVSFYDSFPFQLNWSNLKCFESS